MVISTIANIANRGLISTYISQVTGNHPTSTDLSIAKHIFDPGLKVYISGQGSSMHQVFPNQFLQPNVSNINDSSDIL